LEVDPETFSPPTSLLPKLFTTLSTRYASRPGGYTRIHKFGRRPGDNAPHAILELVDGPRDLRFEIVARAVGRETAQNGKVVGRADALEGELEGLRERTRMGVGKVLRYRDAQSRNTFLARANEWGVSRSLCLILRVLIIQNTLLAEERGSGGHRREKTALASVSRSVRAR
jgi:hypothetical protein